MNSSSRKVRLDELLKSRRFDLSQPSTTNHLSWIIWGAIGSWKTASLATLPPEMLPAFILDFDNKGLGWLRGKFSPGAVRGVSLPTQGKDGWELAGAALDRELRGGKVPWETLVIDSGTFAYSCALQYVLTVQKVSRMSNDPKAMSADWRRYYNYTHGMFEEFLGRVRSLPCNLIVTFHETIERDDEGMIVSIHPSIPGVLHERLPGGFSEIYHSRAVKTSTETTFVWDTQHRSRYHARTEIPSMPPTIPVDFSEVLRIRTQERKPKSARKEPKPSTSSKQSSPSSLNPTVR